MLVLGLCDRLYVVYAQLKCELGLGALKSLERGGSISEVPNLRGGKGMSVSRRTALGTKLLGHAPSSALAGLVCTAMCCPSLCMPYFVPLVWLHGLLQLLCAEVSGQQQCSTAVLYDVLLRGYLVLLQGRTGAALRDSWAGRYWGRGGRTFL